MKKFCTVLSCFLFLPFFLFAQSNYKNGYIITLQGDTLQGFIDYQEWIKNPVTINFKSALQEKTVQEFTPVTIKYFAIGNMEAYESYEGKISLNRIEINKLATGVDTSTAKRTVFLRVLAQGKNMSLFSYTDEIKERFFIQTAELAKPMELIYRRNIDSETGKLASKNLYMGQLWHVAIKSNVDSDKIKRLIETSSYYKSDFLTIASKINEINTTDLLQKGQMPNYRLFAGAGINRTVVAITGNHFLAEGNTTPSYMPKVSVGADFFFNPNVRRLLIRGQFSFTLNKADIYQNRSNSRENVKYHQAFDQKTISFTPQAIYNLYNADKLKLYFGGGLAANYAFYANMKVISEYSKLNGEMANRTERENKYELVNFWFSFPVRTGFILNKRTDIGLLYLAPLPITRYIDYSFTISGLHVEVNYLLGKTSK